MDQSLKEWAAANDLNYHAAYKRFTQNKIPNAYKNSEGSIFVKGEEKSIGILSSPSAEPNWGEPLESSIGTFRQPLISRASLVRRRNASSTIVPTDQFRNIENGLSPFQMSSGNSNVTINEAITLTQLCYYNFNNFRTIIDLLTELSSSKIYLTGGNEKTRTFFNAYLKKINIQEFIEKWFLEYYRSGNVFVYPLESKIDRNYVSKITQVFGGVGNGETSIPTRFIILNPADLVATNGLSFYNATYAKKLNDYEIEILRNPRTDEDKEIFDNLPPDIREKIKNKKTGIMFPLDNAKIRIAFYKKADYEPFAIPMGYGVLKDINFKQELRNVDQAISRTVNQVVLLINLGYEDKNGNYQYSQKMANAIQTIFQNESVGRVLIADFSVKAQFLIPDIANILNPQKYVQIDQDIRIGLNNILSDSGTKFANKSINVKLFTQKLLKARNTFLTSFLNPIIKSVSNALGFKTFPTANFEEFEFKDEVEMYKLFSRSYESGLFTAEETLTAIKTGIIPSPDESLKSQETFKQLKKKGYYEPLLNKGIGNDVGRPKGTTAPKNQRKVGPIGGSLNGDDQLFSCKRIKNTLILASRLETKLTNIVTKKFKTKKLNESQARLIEELCEVIMANENPNTWLNEETIINYLNNPFDKEESKSRIEKLNEIKAKHGLNNLAGCILLNSQNESNG